MGRFGPPDLAGRNMRAATYLFHYLELRYRSSVRTRNLSMSTRPSRAGKTVTADGDGVTGAQALGFVRARRVDLVEPMVKKHGGRVFKLMGDGLFAEFGSADTVLWGQYVTFGNEIRIDATLENVKQQRAVPIKAQAANQGALLVAIGQLAASVREGLALPADIVKELQGKVLRPSTASVAALRYYNDGLQLARHLRRGRVRCAGRPPQYCHGRERAGTRARVGGVPGPARQARHPLSLTMRRRGGEARARNHGTDEQRAEQRQLQRAGIQDQGEVGPAVVQHHDLVDHRQLEVRGWVVHRQAPRFRQHGDQEGGERQCVAGSDGVGGGRDQRAGDDAETARSRRQRQRGHAQNETMSARHGSISFFVLRLRSDDLVVLPQQLLILGHELFLGIRIHLQALGLGTG